MKRLFSKAISRQLSLALAILLLLASGPSTAGIVVLSGPRQPEITINICQPIQTFDCVSNMLLARPAIVLPEFVLHDVGSPAIRAIPQLVDCKIDPDTPPPKRSV
jgi:hypothetical protein